MSFTDKESLHLQQYDGYYHAGLWVCGHRLRLVLSRFRHPIDLLDIFYFLTLLQIDTTN